MTDYFPVRRSARVPSSKIEVCVNFFYLTKHLRELVGRTDNTVVAVQTQIFMSIGPQDRQLK